VKAIRIAWVVAVLAALASGSRAHPLVDNALDVAIAPQRITIDARVSMEQVLLVEAGAGQQPPPPPAREECEKLARRHTEYVLGHVRVLADGEELAGGVTFVSGPAATAQGAAGMASYRLEYVLTSGRPPAGVRIQQTFLREYETWSASCVLRVRQSTEEAFETGLLPRDRFAEFGCDWPVAAVTPTTQPGGVAVVARGARPWGMARTYARKYLLASLVCAVLIGALVLMARRRAR
jgi:hypothetical protein